MSSSWKKRRIHKQRGRTCASGATAIACMRGTLSVHYTSWKWDGVTCLACLKKQPHA